MPWPGLRYVYPPVAFMIWLMRSMRSFMYGPMPPAALFHAPELETSLSEGLLLGGEALRVGLPDVAEGDLGVGEAAG